MFTLTRRFSEPITQRSRLKVKVLMGGHEFKSCFSRPLPTSFTPKTIFIKLRSNVDHSETVCRIHRSHADSKSRSQLKVTCLSFDFHVHSISLSRPEVFSLNVVQIFISLRLCAEFITQPSPSPRLRSQLKATRYSCEFRVPSKSLLPLEGISVQSAVHLREIVY